jgi:drug/metabolite transporter (DMT)-like permease
MFCEEALMAERGAEGSGLGLAIASAATFGTSGTFGSSLIDAGWTPAAAVTARVLIAAVVLSIPAIHQLRGRWSLLRQGAPTIGLYGVFAIAGAQLGFFNAVAHLSVGVALLLEYLGILLVVGWLWIRHGHRPRRLTVVGAMVAIVGLLLVLDLTGSQRVSLVGVCWGLGAAIGLAVYFLVSASAENPLPPLVIACGGLWVGGVLLLLMGACGVQPFRAPRDDVELLHQQVSWLVPVLCLALVAAAFAYVAGIAAARLLGAKLASFVGLTEVLFAVVFAWIFLAQVPAAIQFAGGVLILAGVTLVRVDEFRAPDLEPAIVVSDPSLVS